MGILPVYNALSKSAMIKYYLARHEEGASHAADGYARASGKVGICAGTSGPAGTNMVTGLYAAQVYGIPLIAITGQTVTSLLGKDARQNSEKLAKQLKVSSATVRRRLRKLIAGNLLHIVGIVDPVDFGFPVTAMIALDVANNKLESVVNILANAAQQGDADAKKQLDVLLNRAEILWAPRPPQDLISRSPSLKWIQSPVSGVDSFAIPEIINSKIILNNSSGMHGVQVGEMAVAHMIMLAKSAPRSFRQMKEKRYAVFIPVVLEGKTVLILGLGPIGKYIARLCHGFNMRVFGVRARANVRCPYVEAIFPPERLLEVLPQCDFIVNALPLLASTKKVIGERELRVMKPTAFFVNVGRGGTIDQDALISALSENRIAGAGLDTTTPEPLPSDSKLWELPNVIITPHVSGRREDYHKLATDLFCKNLERYFSGKKLFNIIAKKTLSPKF
ncbi:MAG: NAD(P)-dependent oxidoreductase [Chloroflexota bacterium]